MLRFGEGPRIQEQVLFCFTLDLKIPPVTSVSVLRTICQVLSCSPAIYRLQCFCDSLLDPPSTSHSLSTSINLRVVDTFLGQLLTLPVLRFVHQLIPTDLPHSGLPGGTPRLSRLLRVHSTTEPRQTHNFGL